MWANYDVETLEGDDVVGTDAYRAYMDELAGNLHNLRGAPRTNAAAIIYMVAKDRGTEVSFSEFKRRFHLSYGATAGQVKYLCARRDIIRKKPVRD